MSSSDPVLTRVETGFLFWYIKTDNLGQDMAASNYGERYTTIARFVDLCKEMGIDDVDEKTLELFEKKKFLFPIRRLLLDPEYLKYFWPIENDPNHPHYKRPPFPLPNKWKKQYEVIADTKEWVSIWTYHKIFHPLDKHGELKFVKQPSVSQYRRWGSYETKVGNHPNLEYKSRAIHIYSYWQVYSVFEILAASKIEVYFDITKKHAIGCLLQGKIPKKYVFSTRWPLSPVRKSGDFSGKNKDFDALSFYVNATQRLENLAYVVWTRGEGKLNSEEAYQLVLRNAVRMARLTINRYSLTVERLFDFLKYLCVKYFEYQKANMPKLCEFLKQDIHHLIFLIVEGYQSDFDAVSKRVGRVRGAMTIKNTLDDIFPDELANAKEAAIWTFKHNIKDAQLEKLVSVADSDLHNLFSYMDKHGFFHFYVTIKSFYTDWFSERDFARSHRQFQLIYLSLVPEGLSKSMSKTYADDLRDALKGIFAGKPWWSTIATNGVGGCWRLTSIDSSTDIAVRLKSEIIGGNFHKNPNYNSYIKMILVCGLARNIAAHEGANFVKLDQGVHKTFLTYIVYTTFFCWKEAERKGLV